MKFRLVEDLNTGLENKPSIDTLNEELLFEKYWVELSDGKLPPFYFYAANNEDIKQTLIPIINNTLKGTFKQSLNQKLLQSIRSKYKNVNEENFPFKIQKVEDNNIRFTQENCLSLTDRQLRREANKIGSEYVNLNKVLVHHINGIESDNSKENLLIIDRTNNSPGCEEVARAAHLMLHNKEIKNTGKYGNTYIYEYDENVGKFIKKYKVFLVLTDVKGKNN